MNRFYACESGGYQIYIKFICINRERERGNVMQYIVLIIGEGGLVYRADTPMKSVALMVRKSGPFALLGLNTIRT